MRHRKWRQVLLPLAAGEAPCSGYRAGALFISCYSMAMKNNSFISTLIFLCAFIIAYELPYWFYLQETEYNSTRLVINAAVLGLTLVLFKADLKKYALGKKILQHERALVLLGIVAALQAVVFLVAVLLF
jgi:hypothetical protein